MSRIPRRAAGAAGGSRRDAAGPDGRSHHIADVAHHFLTDTRPEAPYVFVAGPAAGPELARELAAGWARATGLEVGLVEASQRARDPAGPAAPGVGFRGPGSGPRTDESAVFWRLGSVDGGRLDDLDAVTRVPGADLPGAGRRRRILWCLEAEAADLWSPLVGLGRLAGALRTGGVVLVVPAGGRPAEVFEAVRIRAGIATGDHARLVILPESARPGARAAALAGLPELLFPAEP